MHSFPFQLHNPNALCAPGYQRWAAIAAIVGSGIWTPIEEEVDTACALIVRATYGGRGVGRWVKSGQQLMRQRAMLVR